MANDCLVKRLKGVVDNDALPVFNAFVVNIKTIEDTDDWCYGLSLTCPNTYVISMPQGRTVKVDNGSPVSGEVELTGNHNVVFSIGDYNVHVKGLYAFTGIHHLDSQNKSKPKGVSIDTNQLSYAPLQYFVGVSGEFYGSFTPKKKQDYIAINVGRSSNAAATADVTVCDVNLADFNDMPELTTFVWTFNNKLTGSISSLSNSINLSLIDVSVTKASGEINNLAAGQVAAGRTSGVIRVGTSLTMITHDGNLCDYNYITSHGGDGYVLYIEFNSSYTDGYRVVFTNPA